MQSVQTDVTGEGRRKNSASHDLTRGADPALQDHTVQRLAVDDRSSRALARKLRTLESPYRNLARGRLDSYRAVVGGLPPEILSSVVAMRSESAAPGAMILSNLPIDPSLPETPSDGGTSREKVTFVSEGVLLGVASVLGLPFSFAREKDGIIIHSVSPIRGHEKATANFGSNSDFKVHVECAYYPFRPDLLLLLCLRPDRERKAATLVADIRAALQHLSPWDRSVLRQPLFQIQAPLSFASGLGGQPWSEPRPIITGSESSPEVCLNLNGMRAVTPGANTTLELLRHVLESPQVVEPVLLESGDLLVVDNRKAVHGRTPFLAHFDGADRWLQRLYVKIDVWPRRSERGTEIVF